MLPRRGNMNNTLKMKLNVSFLNNFPRATLLPLKSTSNWQTLTVCVRTIFQRPAGRLIKNKHTLYKHT
jgi:hypothetical protein